MSRRSQHNNVAIFNSANTRYTPSYSALGSWKHDSFPHDPQRKEGTFSEQMARDQIHTKLSSTMYFNGA